MKIRRFSKTPPVGAGILSTTGGNQRETAKPMSDGLQGS